MSVTEETIAPEQAVEEAKAPEPMLLPDDLAAYENAVEETEDALIEQGKPAPERPPLLLPTLADAQKAMARLRYFRKHQDEIKAVFDAEETRLRKELEELEDRRRKAMAPWLRHEPWYLYALEQYARAQRAADPNIKSVKLPAGDLKLTAQRPEWQYGDEDALVERLKAIGRSDLVRAKEAPNKDLLKDTATVKDGRAVLLTEEGEIIDLGIPVAERPPKFDLKIAL